MGTMPGHIAGKRLNWFETQSNPKSVLLTMGYSAHLLHSASSRSLTACPAPGRDKMGLGLCRGFEWGGGSGGGGSADFPSADHFSIHRLL